MASQAAGFSRAVDSHQDLRLEHGAIICPTAALVVHPLKPLLPGPPLIRLGVAEREPAGALIGAGAAADARLFAREHETPEPEGGQEGTTRKPQHEARLSRAPIPRPAVERRRSVVERRDEEDGLRERRRLLSGCCHM